ncbi:MAG: MBL fold metallo-hydrolase [Gomphosphaeria aponina SAG 52.96 = DSM 107014]|uniref:MBL fold metallo-hydrolase n=1 Tax=Gomphosphaeria aponina SAG 52.96 = DSM 107014 TaxID=1521640 RepID=A0A941JV75_9CHRO|nr:MBL fold metallo-hydrolase [Gomphosphaeria aponina SAG 52.96 = DSM 107014]
MPSIPEATKPPRPIFQDIFAFPPNRETLGATAYFIGAKNANILVDSPAWNETNRQFLHAQGGVRWLFLTHRGSMTQQVDQMQEFFGCEVICQEQEAYLLPKVRVTSFKQEYSLNHNSWAFWTPGHSPGSSCLYYNPHGGVLFTGRHLLPNQQGKPVPLRTAKTFHWFRQLQNVTALRDRFSSSSLTYICPGANTGYLRGKGFISEAYQAIADLDLSTLQQTPMTNLTIFC